MRIADLPAKHAYCEAWRKAKANPDATFKVRYGEYKTGAECLRDFRRALDRRINERGGLGVRGRKDGANWFFQAARTARELNTPRLAIHWLPLEFRARFSHRITEREI